MYVSSSASIEHSVIADGAIIKGTVKNCVISSNVEVEDGAIVEDSVIMSNTKIKKNAKVKKAIIGENVIVHENSKIYDEQGELYSIGNNLEIRGDE